MAEFRSVGRVQVSLWGRKVGVLVPSPERGYYAFKFDRSFLDSGIQIASLMMPLAAAPYQFVDLPRNAYEGLPPCFADSLPDGFGNSLIRRWARDRKYDIDELPALNKLCYVGNRAMGALLRAVAGDGGCAGARLRGDGRGVPSHLLQRVLERVRRLAFSPAVSVYYNR